MKVIASFLSIAFLLSTAYYITLRHDLPIGKVNERHLQRKEIPRIAHYALLGASTPKYMKEMVRVSMERIEATGFEVKLWNEEEADRLIADFRDPLIKQSWEYVKQSKENSRYAKMADFLRPLILYVEGGVYLDADMVPCESLDYMVAIPGVVTFPFLYGRSDEVNGALMSAPPGHFLMKLALDAFVSLGPDIRWMNNLIAAGPKRMSIVTDYYLEVIGYDLPLLFSTNDLDGKGPNPYTDAPHIAKKNGYWTQIADIRFGEPTTTSFPYTYHLHFGSWINRSEGSNGNSICYDKTELIESFIDNICTLDHRGHNNRFSDCGSHLSEDHS